MQGEVLSTGIFHCLVHYGWPTLTFPVPSVGLFAQFLFVQSVNVN